MRIRLRRAASADLRAITNYIVQDDPEAAQALVQQIDERFSLMAAPGFAGMGHPGWITGTRHIVVSSHGIVYRYDERRREIVILSVTHGARRR